MLECMTLNPMRREKVAVLKKESEKKKAPKATSVSEKPKRRLPIPKFLRRFGGYFKGSWQELRQTKWPTRKAAWQLTVAVIIFTTVLMVFIVSIDYLFDLLFQRLVL